MTTTRATPVPPGSVVVGIDGSPHSDRALTFAAEQAALEVRPLLVLHVVNDLAETITGDVWVPPVAPEDLERAGHAMVDAALSRATGAHPELESTGRVVRSDVRRELREASTVAALLVLGSHGRGGVASTVLGSVGAHLARHAECPVVVCRPGHPGRVSDGVVVAADGSPSSAPVLEHAFRQASLHHLPLTVVHGVDLGRPHESERRMLAEAVAGYGEEFPDVHVEVQVGDGPVAALVRTGRHPHDLVVVGRHPVAGTARTFARTTATVVLEHADGPVAIVPVG